MWTLTMYLSALNNFLLIISCFHIMPGNNAVSRNAQKYLSLFIGHDVNHKITFEHFLLLLPPHRDFGNNKSLSPNYVISEAGFGTLLPRYDKMDIFLKKRARSVFRYYNYYLTSNQKLKKIDKRVLRKCVSNVRTNALCLIHRSYAFACNQKILCLYTFYFILYEFILMLDNMFTFIKTKFLIREEEQGAVTLFV